MWCCETGHQNFKNSFTGRNEVVAKVMFLQVSVILSTGGGSPENPPGTKENPPPGPRRTPPRDQGEPPRTKESPPWDQGEPPPGPRRTPPGTKENPPPDQGEPPLGPRRTPPDQAEPPPPGRRLQHTVNERPVRIILECNLVRVVFFSLKIYDIGLYL